MNAHIRVSKVFMVKERRRVLAVLDSFEWTFALGATVDLCGKGVCLEVRQAGSGNHEGHAVVELAALVPWEEAEDALRLLQKQADEGEVVELVARPVPTVNPNATPAPKPTP